MMVRNRDLVAAIDEELDAASFQDDTHNGLQVEGREEIRRIASGVSVSRAFIDAALAWGADAVLTHHGLLWRKEPLHVQGVRRGRLKALLQNDLNLLSYHLPLDAHPVHGNNAALADVAGCIDTQPGLTYGGMTIGILGSLPEPTPFAAWLERFRKGLIASCAVETGPFQVWPFGPDKVHTIGFVSGGGQFQVHDAIEAGCDVFVTGEVTEAAYHLAKEAGIHYVGAGHYLTERFGVQRLGAWIEERFKLEVRYFDVETLA